MSNQVIEDRTIECKVSAEYKFACECGAVHSVWTEYNKYQPKTIDTYAKCKSCKRTYMIRFDHAHNWNSFKERHIEGSYLLIDNPESNEQILILHSVTHEKRGKGGWLLLEAA